MPFVAHGPPSLIFNGRYIVLSDMFDVTVLDEMLALQELHLEKRLNAKSRKSMLQKMRLNDS